jgi:hypothetical protein
MKVKVGLIALALLLSAGAMAQHSKKKKAKEPVKAEVKAASKAVSTEEVVAATTDENGAFSAPEVMVMDVCSEEAVAPASNGVTGSLSQFKPMKSIRYDSRYETVESINDSYDYYCERDIKNKSEHLGIVDKKGNVVLPHLFGRSYQNAGSSCVMLNINSSYGVFNLNELRWSIPMEYAELANLGNGLFRAKKGSKWGVIDSNNRVIVPFEWSEIGSLSNLENYIRVTQDAYPNDLYGVYSLVEKRLVIPCSYTSLYQLDGQSYFSVSNGTKYNHIDISNTPRFKTWYDEISENSKGRNCYIVKNNGRYGVVNDSERVVVPIEYLEFNRYAFSDGSHFARNKEGKYGFITIDGRVTLPFQYDKMTKSSGLDNMVAVQNGRCGLVQVNDGMPYEITTCSYDDIQGSNKVFIVEKGGKYGLLDSYGKPITEIKYRSLVALDRSSSNGGLYVAQTDDRFDLISESGRVINSEPYAEIIPIVKGERASYYEPKYTYLKAKTKSGKYQIIDKVGATNSKTLFDDITSENGNLFIVKSKDRYGLYSLLDQKLVVEYEFDSIVMSKEGYIGFNGKKITILVVKSGEVTKIETVK